MHQAGTHTRLDDVDRAQGHLLLVCTVVFVTMKVHN